MTQNPEVPGLRRLEWGPAIVLALGVGVLGFGARGFHLRGHFGLIDALYCALLLVPAGILLLVTSYVAQHAKFVVVIPVLFAAVTVVTYPAFGVALGIALIAVVAGPLLGEWRSATAIEKG